MSSLFQQFSNVLQATAKLLLDVYLFAQALHVHANDIECVVGWPVENFLNFLQGEPELP